MDSDAGSSLTRRRHRPFSLFLYLSSPFVSFIDLLQICLLFLGFLSSSFVHGCTSCR
ncbi:BnaC05g14380D [Brassica napus]|uniref:BnaC05g14380D protein n=1 Tax=Brassica napus TaxID=3708 RepID=A0A078G2I3_BRANA|nr:BnaC05g14380D [Brassica napus]